MKELEEKTAGCGWRTFSDLGHSELSARDGYFIFGLSLGRYGGESEVDALAVAAAVDLGEIVAGARPIPDLVNRDFTAQAPGEKMVGDITYIPTWRDGCFSLPLSTARHAKWLAGRWMTITGRRSSPRRSKWPPGISAFLRTRSSIQIMPRLMLSRRT